MLYCKLPLFTAQQRYIILQLEFQFILQYTIPKLNIIIYQVGMCRTHIGTACRGPRVRVFVFVFVHSYYVYYFYVPIYNKRVHIGCMAYADMQYVPCNCVQVNDVHVPISYMYNIMYSCGAYSTGHKFPVCTACSLYRVRTCVIRTFELFFFNNITNKKKVGIIICR